MTLTAPDYAQTQFVPPTNADWLSDTNEVTKTFLAAGQIPGLINLAGGLPEPSLYPHGELAEIARKVMLEHPHDTLNYPPIDGLTGLRDVIAERYSTDKLQLTRDNVLITTAGMQGLDLMGKALLNFGEKIAVQSPAYLGAIDAWKPRHPAYEPMFPDRNDFDPVAHFSGAKFAYTVPNFSNPTGKLVGVAQREAMVDAAFENGTWILEDDPYGALYYDSEPLPCLIDICAQRDPGPYRGPVIYLGTFSKQVAPGLRVGWMIAPAEMIETLAVVKQGSDMCTSGLSQLIVKEAYESGLADRILPDILNLYRERRNALCDAMDKYLTPFFTWEKPVGGMFVWATAKSDKVNTNELMKIGMEEKVCVSPSSVFDPLGQDRSSARINFTLNAPDKLEEGVRRLAKATERHLAS